MKLSMNLTLDGLKFLYQLNRKERGVRKARKTRIKVPTRQKNRGNK